MRHLVGEGNERRIRRARPWMPIKRSNRGGQKDRLPQTKGPARRKGTREAGIKEQNQERTVKTRRSEDGAEGEGHAKSGTQEE